MKTTQTIEARKIRSTESRRSAALSMFKTALVGTLVVAGVAALAVAVLSPFSPAAIWCLTGGIGCVWQASCIACDD